MIKLDQILYTNEGIKTGSGTEMRILSARESESDRYQFYGQNLNLIRYESIEAFRKHISDVGDI